MKEEEFQKEWVQQRKDVFWQIMKVIDESTDYNGEIKADYFKKELLIQVFSEIPLEVINK